jgi:hypothetical protein
VKAETIDGGICAVKAACAADDACDGFVWRVRDGAGLLGRGFRILDAHASATKTRLARFDRKAPRGVMLFLKRPRTLLMGKGVKVVAGVALPPERKATRRRRSGDDDAAAAQTVTQMVTQTASSTILASGTTVRSVSSSAHAPPLPPPSAPPPALSSSDGSACLDLSAAPWLGSPPMAHPLRRREDPEVGLLRRSPAMVNAFAAPALTADAPSEEAAGSAAEEAAGGGAAPGLDVAKEFGDLLERLPVALDETKLSQGEDRLLKTMDEFLARHLDPLLPDHSRHPRPPAPQQARPILPLSLSGGVDSMVLLKARLNDMKDTGDGKSVFAQADVSPLRRTQRPLSLL